jgi:ABC-2 type transport system ATP-binding protein
MIRAKNVTRKFGNSTAVDRVTFEVAAGEIFAFLGPNGAGKTTVIRMLTTLLPVTSGTIEIDGFDPARQKNEVRRRFGIVFQDPSLEQELTAWENMELHGALYGTPRRVWSARAEALLTGFDLWDRKDSSVREFSGGMRRRLEIARSLLHTPKILFLDEPTLGLDPQSRSQLWAQVKQLNQRDGVTVFLTTHYLDEADRVASRIAIIDHGRIIALGTSAELKERTRTHTLEDTFLTLTGAALRDEIVDSSEQIRIAARTVRR